MFWGHCHFPLHWYRNRKTVVQVVNHQFMWKLFWKMLVYSVKPDYKANAHNACVLIRRRNKMQCSVGNHIQYHNGWIDGVKPWYSNHVICTEYVWEQITTLTPSVCVPGAGVFQHWGCSAGLCGAGAVGKVLRKKGDIGTAQESCSTAARHGCTVKCTLHQLCLFKRLYPHMPVTTYYCILSTVFNPSHICSRRNMSIPRYLDRHFWPVQLLLWNKQCMLSWLLIVDKTPVCLINICLFN